MRVYFTTVVRSAPVHGGGELVALDFAAKRVLRRVPIRPENPTLDDPNSRGNTRGGRGIALVDGQVVAASYHTLRLFDRELNPLRDVSHPLMASLHEGVPAGGGLLWTTSTAIDAALLIDLAGNRLVDARWPREQAGLKRALGLEPLAIDKAADARGAFLSSAHTRHPSHLHLNAVALHDGRLYGLFSKFGVIADLDRDRIVAADKALKGAHNLRVDAQGVAAVSHTLGRGILFFDLASGRRVGSAGFGGDPVVRRLLRGKDFVYGVKRFLEKRGLHPGTPPRPAFVRGLAPAGAHWLVGISPATLLLFDARAGRVVDHYTHSSDVAECVHGLEVAG